MRNHFGPKREALEQLSCGDTVAESVISGLEVVDRSIVDISDIRILEDDYQV